MGIMAKMPAAEYMEAAGGKVGCVDHREALVYSPLSSDLYHGATEMNAAPGVRRVSVDCCNPVEAKLLFIHHWWATVNNNNRL